MLAFAFLVLQMVNKVIFLFHQLLYFALECFDLLFAPLENHLIDQNISIFVLMLGGIMHDGLRIYQSLVFFNDLLLYLVDLFVLCEGYLRLLLQHLDEFIVHYY
jgi:hypothetical protein